MSDLYQPAFADPHYAIIRPGGRNATLAGGPGTPAGLGAPAAGYEKGCIFQNYATGAVYVNTGTTTVAVWQTVTVT
jgi:hypothetical protein